MYLNLQTGCLGLGNLPLDERIRLARAYGYGGLDVPLDGIRTEADAQAACEKIAAAGLKCGLFWLPCDPSSADEATFTKAVGELRRIAPLAAKVGLRRTYCHIWSGNNERPYEENWKWHVARLRMMTEFLRPYGIQFGIEFLGPHHLRTGCKYGFMHTLDEALKLIAEVPGTGLVFDTYHWYCSGGTVEGLERKLAGVPIVNVHTNDARPDRTREQQQDMERSLPLEHGVIDLKAVLKILRAMRYDGPVIVEPFRPWTERFAKMGADAACKQVAELMLPLLRA